MLHLKDEGESLWDDPDEEFIKIVTTGEGGSEDVEEGSSETSYDSEESDESWANTLGFAVFTKLCTSTTEQC